MKLKRGDLILAAGLLVAAVLLALGLQVLAPQGKVAVVVVDGVECARLDLSEDTVLTVNGTHLVVVEGGTVRVGSAPCPDQICVRHEAISRAGETIVCLPYKLTVTVEEAA